MLVVVLMPISKLMQYAIEREYIWQIQHPLPDQKLLYQIGLSLSSSLPRLLLYEASQAQNWENVILENIIKKRQIKKS